MKKWGLEMISLLLALTLSSCGTVVGGNASRQSAVSSAGSRTDFIPQAVSPEGAAGSKPGRLQALAASLKTEKSVKECVISPDEQKIAVLQDTPGSEEARIITVSSGEVTAVTGISKDDLLELYDLAWSFDGRFLSINAGTSMMCATYVVNAVTGKMLKSFASIGSVLWSPSRDSLAVAAVSQKVPLSYQGTELSNANDIAVYDVNSLSERIILPADPAYYISLSKWDKTGLTAVRHYLAEENFHDETVKLNVTG